MIELKVDPEFRDVCRPMTETEFSLLEESILEFGKVKDPISVWNGTIIDGHNRYAVIQKHPKREIPFTVNELTFSNRSEAIIWICKNQRARRNMTASELNYLSGRQYEEEKMLQGTFHGNQYASAGGQNVQHQNGREQQDGTAGRIGKEYGMNGRTVRRNAEYSKGVDEAEILSPGAKGKLLSGAVNIPKSVVASIPQLEEEEKKSVIDMIAAGTYKKPSHNPAGYNHEMRKNRSEIEAIVSDMYDPSTVPEFTLDFLIEDIQVNAESYVQMLRNTLSDRSTLLTEENRPIIADAIEKYVISEIIKVKELVER